MLPVLHEPTFMKEVQDVYEGSTDPFKNFKLKMVLAIGLQKYSRKYEIMADSYFLAGLQHVDAVLDPMDHSTLQCLLVMVQYALVKPTRIAVEFAPRNPRGYEADQGLTGLSHCWFVRAAVYSAGVSPGENNHAQR
jgi:hypothetical protein